jgi:molecular chaperone GrpE
MVENCKVLLWQNTRLPKPPILSKPLIFQRFRKMSEKPDAPKPPETNGAHAHSTSNPEVDTTANSTAQAGEASFHDSAEPLGETQPEVISDAEALALAQARATEYKDLYTRSLAEVQNIRRRAQEDVSKAHKFAVESFAEALLPVRDSLEMSLTLENLTPESLKEGVQATLRQLASAMEKNKVIELNPVGEKLDPNRHQAISMVPGSATEPATASGHVVSVLQKGYLINDRLLRPALVTVAS